MSKSEAVRAGATAPTAQVGARGWYTIIILTFIYTVSFADRNFLALVIGAAKADLGFSDFAASLLLGLSFAVLFSVLIIPAGYLADRVNRTRMIGGAVFLWSAMELTCGLARNYLQLFLGRMGLGIGESGLIPAAYSLIRDSFPPERRGIAFSIYAIGPYFGTGLALFSGGLLLQAADNAAFQGIPLLSWLKPWQVALAIPGLVGLPLAFVMLSIREPPRPTATPAEETTNYGTALRHIGRHWRLYVPITAAFTLFSIGAGGFAAWMPEAIFRAWGVPRADIGKALGPITIVFTVTGLFVLGSLIDRLTRRGIGDAAARVGAVSTLLSVLCCTSLLMVTSHAAIIGIYMAQAFFFSVFNPACISSLAQVTPSRLLGKIASINSVAANLLGLATGPTIVALAAPLFSGPIALGHAMIVTFMVSVLGASLCLFAVSRELRRRPIALA